MPYLMFLSTFIACLLGNALILKGEILPWFILGVKIEGFLSLLHDKVQKSIIFLTTYKYITLYNECSRHC